MIFKCQENTWYGAYKIKDTSWLDNESIDEIEKIDFLGVIIDNKLNWKEHIAYIAGNYPEALVW